MPKDELHLTRFGAEGHGVADRLIEVDRLVSRLAATEEVPVDLRDRVFAASRWHLTRPGAGSAAVISLGTVRLGARSRVALAAGMGLAFVLGAMALLRSPRTVDDEIASNGTAPQPPQLIAIAIADSSNPEYDEEVASVNNVLDLSGMSYTEIEQELAWFDRALRAR
jgi:hypothetical protein